MLTAALLVLAGLSDPVQVNATTVRFYDPDWGVVCYLVQFKNGAPALSCVPVPVSPMPSAEKPTK